MAKQQKGFGFNISLGLDQFNKDCKAVQKAFDELFGRDLMQMSNAAMGAIAGVGAALSGIAVAAYNLGSKMDALKTSMEATWGSAAKATEQYNRLKQITENSSFGLEQLDKLDKIMAALGLDSESAAEMVRRLADIGTANPGASMEALADGLLKIKTTGKVSAKSLQEFAKVGIEVSDVIGMNATEAINTLMDRMNKFDGYLEGEATDIWSQIPRTVKTVEDAVASLGNYINDNFKDYVVAAGDVVSDLRDEFNAFLNDEGGLAQLEETVIDFAEAITIMAIPALGKLAVGMAPVVIKAGAVILALEGIRDLMRGFRGEGSIILTTFKAVFSQMASWVAALMEKIADANVELAIMIRKGAELSGSSTLTEKAGNLYADAEKSRAKWATFVRKNIDEQTREFWEEWDAISTKATEESLTGKLFSLLGKAEGTLEGKLGSYKLGEKGRKRKKISTVTANNPTGTATAKTEESSGSGNSLFSSIRDKFNEIKEAASECYKNVADWVSEANDKLEEQEKWVKEGQQNFKDWEDSMKGALLNGFADSLTEAMFASKNFFQSVGESLQNLGKQILAQIAQMLILTTLFRVLGISSGSIAGISTMSSWKSGSIRDGIVQNGHIVTTDPQDYIVATKDPSSLGGKASVVVNVTNNSSNEVKTNSHFDGTRTIVDIVIDGLNRNVSGFRDMVKAL